MPGSLAPTLLLLAQLSAQPAPAPRADTAPAPEAETLKERLSDKASDEQRVDNCRVDPARRGATPRPDCALPAQSASGSSRGDAR